MKDLTKVEFFVEDARVGRLQRLVMGLGGVYDFRTTPVVNATAKNGKVKARISGSIHDLFAAYIAKHKLTHVNASVAKAFATENGMSATSYSYILKQAQVSGLIRKAHGKGTRTGYNVVEKKS